MKPLSKNRWLFLLTGLTLILTLARLAAHAQPEALASAASPARTEAAPRLRVAWVQRNPGPAAQNAPQSAYDPRRDEVMLVWEDARHDPQGAVDFYGLAYNSDIFARRFAAATGQVVAQEIPVATRGEHPPGSGRFDNEQRPAVIFDPYTDRYVISWQMFPDSVLESGDLHVSTCNDVNLRAYYPEDGRLGQVIADLAWYTSPPDIISPWGVHYDWSCQQDPVMALLGPDVTLTLWHDHRERYEKGPDGVPLEKDVYGQLLAGDRRQVEAGFLISRDEAGARLPRYQEHPDIAGEGAQWLVVWEDERHSRASSSHGFREIAGRFITYEDGALHAGRELFIAQGQEGDGPEDYRLIAPRVGYLPEEGLYVLVWSRAMGYADSADTSYLLMMAILDRQGILVQSPTPLAGTAGRRAQAHDMACAAGRCVLVYRDHDLVLRARLITADGAQPMDIRVDDAAGAYGYADVQPGAIRDEAVSFFASYVVGSEVHLARLDTLLPGWAPPDPTPAPTATPAPSPTPHPSPTPWPCGDAFEPDDRWEQASLFPLASVQQRRSFHHPGDVDYARFTATRGQTFIIATANLAPGVDTALTLLAPDGVTPLMRNDDDPFHAPASRILWRASRSGDYFVQVAQADASGDCHMTYTLTIEGMPAVPRAPVYLPMLAFQ